MVDGAGLAYPLNGAPWLPPLRRDPSPNHYKGRGGRKITLLVAHDEEGFIRSSEALFDLPSSHVSAHYIVAAAGDDIVQQVSDEDAAWHACSFNLWSIGVEKDGFASKGYSDVEEITTARLFAHLADKWSIPIVYSDGNSPGITTHWKLGRTGGGHTDPEPNDAYGAQFVALVKQEHDAGRFPKTYDPVTARQAVASTNTLATTAGVQHALQALGFDIKVDGILGQATERIVTEIQIMMNIPTRPRGTIDDATRAGIVRALSGG